MRDHGCGGGWPLVWTVFVMNAGCVHPTIKDSGPADTVADTEESVPVIPLEDGFEQDLTLTSAYVNSGYEDQWGVVATNPSLDVRLQLGPEDPDWPWIDGAELELDEVTSDLGVWHGGNKGEGYKECPTEFGDDPQVAFYRATAGAIHVSVGVATAQVTLANIVLECSYPCYEPPYELTLTIPEWSFTAPWTECYWDEEG